MGARQDYWRGREPVDPPQVGELGMLKMSTRTEHLQTGQKEKAGHNSAGGMLVPEDDPSQEG
jgi:hypothetical protein